MSAPEPVAWVDGALVPLARATVSVLDEGFRTGTGVFETLRAYDGRPFRLAAHLDRAEAGAARLGFAIPRRVHLQQAVTATIAANRDLAQDLAVRLTVTPGAPDATSPWPLPRARDCTVVVTAHPLPPVDEHGPAAVTAITVPWGRELAEVKALSYVTAGLARQRARDAGADEALLTDRQGHVTEGAGSNLFVVSAGRLSTPPTDGALLAGVTRATVLELADDLGIAAVEAPLTLAAVQAADEAFLTASTRELAALVTVDGHRIGTGQPGPVCRSLWQAYRQQVVARGHQP